MPQTLQQAALVALGLVFGLFLTVQSALADFSEMTPRALLERSVIGPSLAEREQIRAFLAERHPDTAEGLTSRAWLAGRMGDLEDQDRLYRAAIARAPDLWLPAFNLAMNLRDAGGDLREADALLDQALAANPNDGYLIRARYFFYRDDMNDPAAADRFLAAQRARLGAGHWSMPMIQAFLAQEDGHLQRAADLFLQAAMDGGDDEPIGNYLSLAIDSLNTDVDAALRNALTFAARHRSGAALRMVADRLVRANRHREAMGIYREAMTVDPHAEVLQRAVTELMPFLPMEVISLVDTWAPRLDHIWLANNVHALTLDRYRFDLTRAVSLHQRAIRIAPTDQSRTSAVTSAVAQMHERFDLDAARAVLDQVIPTMRVEAMRNFLISLLIENRHYAGDLAGATAALARLPQGPSVPGVGVTWLFAERERVNRAIRLAVEREEFYRRNPFLRSWDEQFGGSLTLAVEFETNSDVLRPSSHTLLDAAARALQAPGGEEYVFLIEGHTDITGTDEINMPLSDRRAASVAEYLSRVHAIPRERLQSAGFGPRHPIATNDTDAGRQRNRRVEIRPYGRVGEPEVAVSGAIDGGVLAVSGDGRLMATGSGPIQLWDVRRQVRVRELFRGGGERAFSPNNRYLAVTSRYTEQGGQFSNALYVYDTKTGHVVGYMPDSAQIRSISWSPYSDEIAMATDAGYVRIYNLAEGRVRAVNRLSVLRRQGFVAWLPDNRIVTDQVYGPGLVVWNPADLSQVRTVSRTANFPFALRATHDGAWLVSVDNDRTATIYDTRSWTPRTLTAPVAPTRMAAHPSRPWVVMNDTRGGQTGVAVLDLERGRFMATAPANGAAGVGFSADGTQVFVSEATAVRRLDSAALTEINQIQGRATAATGLLADPDNLLLISEDGEGAQVFSLRTGRRVHPMVTRSVHGWTSLGGGRFGTVDTDGHLVVFDAADFSERRHQALGFEVSGRLIHDGTHLMAYGTPIGQTESGSASGIVAVFDSQTLSERHRQSLPLVSDRPGSDRIFRPEFVAVAISAELDLIAVSTSWREGAPGMPTNHASQIKLLRLGTGQPAGQIAYRVRGQERAEVFSLEFDGAAGHLAVTTYGSGTLHFAPDGRWLRSVPAQATLDIALSDGRTVQWTRDVIRLGQAQVTFPDSVRRVVAVEPANMLIAQTLSNELLFFDLATLQRHLTIAVMRDRNWIAYTPDGFFSASQNGAEGVYWSLGDLYLPFDALRNARERGQLVQQRLEALLAGRPVPEAPLQPETVLDPSLFEAPYEVTLVSSTGVETTAATYRLELRIAKAAADLPDPEVRYTLNGRPVPLSRGFEEEAFFDDGAPSVASGETLGLARLFTLQDGYNRIEASVTFRGAQIGHQIVEVTRRAPATPAPAVQPTAQLWVFAVGVSDYEITTQNLEFAHRDAEQLAATLSAQQDRLFRRVNTMVLVNEDATDRNIRIRMNDFLRQASEEDLIVIFLAGHGVQDNEQNLFFISHDADVERPFTGLTLDFFRDFLRGRPINQKALLLIDICHAGSVGPRRRGGGRVVAEDAVQRLSDGTGLVVLASSTGTQSSLEGAEFGGGHGAFTAALLEALGGAADREAGNGDGINTLQEVISYTLRRVPELTSGAQHPTVPMSENVRDFPVSLAMP